MIVGHSFVPRLRDFVHNDPNVDNNFDLNNASVQFCGRGGLTLNRLKELESRIRRLGQADWAIMVLGDNDIGRYDVPQTVAEEIINASEEVKVWTGATKVIICTMFPRFWKPIHDYFVPEYNQRAAAVNCCLLELVDNEKGFYVWSTDRLAVNNPKADKYFDCDGKNGGVHLNDPGNFLFYKSIKRAIGVLKQVSL